MKFGARVSDSRGQVVITRFECPSLYALLTIRALHSVVKPDVRRRASGFVGVTAMILWSERTLLSISLWESLDSIYSMGHVNRHILAARVPHRLGVQTSSAIYTYRGDWRSVLFDTSPEPRSEPIRKVGAEVETEVEVEVGGRS